MGQEIDAKEEFSEADFERFREHLREETSTLKNWFETRHFRYDEAYTVGLELEAWLIDRHAIPAARNVDFLNAIADPNVVEELAAFNFEVNAPPQPLSANTFTNTEADLSAVWDKCNQTCKQLDMRPVAIGILPTLTDEIMQPSAMSDTNRYRALNREILRRRQAEPLHISIEGKQKLDYRCDHIMLEAACTSLQAHIRINQEDCVRFYNAGVLSCAPLVAACANSPYLYQHELWHETRIAAFEQATALEGFRNKEGDNVLRVSLGTRYLRHSFLELFLENLSFPTILPAQFEQTGKLPHLRLHNGTIWRWVRPIIGFDDDGTPHLRIEHRVVPAGPSLADSTANLALCHGLMLSLAHAEIPPEDETRFRDARANFYAAAKHGLSAEVKWAGRSLNVQTLLLEHLLSRASEALITAGVDKAEIEHYFEGILKPRIQTGQTGAAWQKKYIAENGSDFQAMTEAYIAHQITNAPVHTWKI